jgi:hypothetical protein
MRLSKGILFAGLASAILFAVSAPAKAGSVFADTSTNGLAYVEGTATGGFVDMPAVAAIASVNGAPPPGPLTIGIGQAILTYTSISPTLDIITGGTGTKVITDSSGNAVIIELKILNGVAEFGTLDIRSLIVAVNTFGGNGMPDGLNWHTLVGGTTTISLNDTTFNYASVLGHAGTKSPTSLLSVSEAVPEPTSVALLGIGMAGFFTYRRLFKRTASV